MKILTNTTKYHQINHDLPAKIIHYLCDKKRGYPDWHSIDHIHYMEVTWFHDKRTVNVDKEIVSCSK
jgi:hypothetical protein